MRSTAAAWMCIVLAGCFAAPPATSAIAEEASTREEINETFSAFKTAVITGDIPGVLTQVTDDFRLTEPGILATGIDEFETTLTSIFETYDITAFESIRRDLFIHGDVAYDFGDFDETFVVGGDTTMFMGYYAIRWERGAEGVWKMDRLVAGPRGNASEDDI
jgi:ketosteroid isomerase-like protein